jgi:hypothetical protein
MTEPKFIGGKALMEAEPPKRKVLTFGETPDGLPNTSSPLNTDSLSPVSSLPVEHTPAIPADSLPAQSSPPIVDSLPNTDKPDLLSIVPRVAGHTPLPHTYADHICHWLSADEQAVYVQLYRLSWGWQKETCFISNRRLSERSGVPLSSMRRAVAKLERKRLIEKTNRVFGSNAEQGIEYRVFNLSSLSKTDSPPNTSSLSNMTPNKEKLLKETDKGLDASGCPDCFGTGMWYPEGFDKGVARCSHQRLSKT